MWNEDGHYFDYVEIRRRIERRLASGVGLVVHLALFLLACVIGAALHPPYYYFFNYGVFSYSGTWHVAALLMLAWSLVLAFHGLQTYRRAGTASKRRFEAVEDELTERYEADDTELLASPRQAFRVQALLNEDIRLRAGWIVSLDVLLAGNVLLWLAHAADQGRDPAHWKATLLFAVLALPVIFAVNRVRRMRRDARLRRILRARRADEATSAKRKRSFDDELERYARLADDGELTDLPDDWALSDRKAKRG